MVGLSGITQNLNQVIIQHLNSFCCSQAVEFILQLKGQLQQLEQVDCKRIQLAGKNSRKAQPKVLFKILVQHLQESAESEHARVRVLQHSSSLSHDTHIYLWEESMPQDASIYTSLWYQMVYQSILLPLAALTMFCLRRKNQLCQLWSAHHNSLCPTPPCSPPPRLCQSVSLELRLPPLAAC